jgi:hypothetical protein
MRSLLEKKSLVLFLSVLALGALTVLSVSLQGVSFGDAQPIGREQAEQAGRPSQLLPPLTPEAMQSQVVLWVALIVLITLVGLLLSPEARKRMLRILLRVGFTGLALYLLFTRYPEMFEFLDPESQGQGPRPSNVGAEQSLPPPVFTPPQETPWLSYAVSLLIILGLVFLMWRAYRMWQAMNQRSSRSLQDLARIARASLHDISDGRETTDVIMNCYFRMSDAVADRKNLQRGSSMTPAEFASRLQEAGLPGEAVRRLTRLFEGVRYGQRKAGPKDINEAVACLTAILQYCGEPV